MKHNIFLILFSVFIYSCHSREAEPQAVKSQSATAVKPKQTLSAEEVAKYNAAVKAIVDKSLLRGSFNGAILVAKDGDIVYENYVGLQDPRVKGKDSIQATTAFQIASTGKTMTAAAILKLWQEGKLNIDDELSKYFPTFPYPGVTIKTLLNHRSGLPNYLYYMEKGEWNRQQQATNADVLQTLITWQPPKAANADKRFQYCNTNYVLLALLVEKISGVSFPEFMQKEIFEPLGMTNSFVIGVNQQEGKMQSFQHNNHLWSLDFSDGPYGDKNIYSTPRDLLIWDKALQEGKVLSEETLQAAYTPYSNEKPGIHNYGFGWRMLNFKNGKKVIYHNGHWHGFNSAFSRLPDEKATIIILSNKINNGVYSTAKKLYEVFGDYDGKPDDGEE